MFKLECKSLSLVLFILFLKEKLMKKNIFIAIDGVDGIGKTTTARNLSLPNNFCYYRPGSSIYFSKKINNEKKEASLSVLEKYACWRVCIQYDSIQISRLLKETSVVCDGYIATRLAYFISQDERIGYIQNNNNMLKPDFSFLLHAKSEARNKRILECKYQDAVTTIDNLYLDRVQDILKSRLRKQLDLVAINSSKLTTVDVNNFIKRHIEEQTRANR